MRLPEVPEIVRLNVPIAAVADAVRVSVDEALPPAVVVTLVGENVAVTPLGNPAILRLVVELNALRLPTVTVVLPLLPWTTLSEVGDRLREKSGGALTTRVRFTE